MKIPKEFEDVFSGVELTENELRTLTWITGWESRTVENLRSAIQKVQATALSTLQAENEQLRAELEEASKLIKEQEEFHNKSLETADKATAQSSEFLDDLKRMKQEQDAAVAELEQVKREKSSIEQDFRAFAKQWWEEDSGFPCRWCKFERQDGCEWKVKHPGEICAGRAFEWRGQKEDIHGAINVQTCRRQLGPEGAELAGAGGSASPGIRGPSQAEADGRSSG